MNGCLPSEASAGGERKADTRLLRTVFERKTLGSLTRPPFSFEHVPLLCCSHWEMVVRAPRAGTPVGSPVMTCDCQWKVRRGSGDTARAQELIWGLHQWKEASGLLVKSECPRPAGQSVGEPCHTSPCCLDCPGLSHSTQMTLDWSTVSNWCLQASVYADSSKATQVRFAPVSVA